MRLLFFIPPIIWTVFVAIISLLNSSAIPSNTWLDKFHADKVVHALLYGLMAYLYYHAFRKNGWPVNFRNVIGLSSIIAGVSGIVIEMLQWAMQAGRYFDLLDIMANITGVLISVFLIKERIH